MIHLYYFFGCVLQTTQTATHHMFQVLLLYIKQEVILNTNTVVHY